MSRLQTFSQLTREELANSPSRRDGVPENMERRRRKLTAQHMQSVSYDFKMGITTWATAVTFFNRFYARKSMKKNNTFVIACASLFLAGKVNDQPRPHDRLTNEMLKRWYGKDNPQLKTLAMQRVSAASAGAAQPDFWTSLYGAVLEAERALLYTVGFDFNVPILHTLLARLLNRPRFKGMGLKENKDFQQYIINIANDVYMKDGTLLLQYPMEKIAVAAYYLVFKHAKTAKAVVIPQPPATAEGALPWYAEEGLSVPECTEITTAMMDRLYSKDGGGMGGGTGGGPQQQQAAGGATRRPGATATTGAASTAMLGACESVAYSGGGTTLAGGGGRSEVASGADALGEHTSMQRPLSSDLGSVGAAGGAVSGGGKRAAQRPAGAPGPAATAAAAAAAAAAAHGGAEAGHPCKRARHEGPPGAASHEATSGAAAMRPPPPVANGRSQPAAHPTNPALISPTDATPAMDLDSKATPAFSPPYPTSGVAVAAPAVSPQYSPSSPHYRPPDSDKEEGELEEGELH